jgi:hypothetical protein
LSAAARNPEQLDESDFRLVLKSAVMNDAKFLQRQNRVL